MKNMGIRKLNRVNRRMRGAFMHQGEGTIIHASDRNYVCAKGGNWRVGEYGKFGVKRSDIYQPFAILPVTLDVVKMLDGELQQVN